MDIDDWLRSIGLEHYAPTFRENGIDLGVLPDLTDPNPGHLPPYSATTLSWAGGNSRLISGSLGGTFNWCDAVTTQNVSAGECSQGFKTVCTNWASYRTYTAMTKADLRFGMNVASMTIAAGPTLTLPVVARPANQMSAVYAWGPTSETGLPATFP